MKYIQPWYLLVFAVCSVSLWGCNQHRTATINAKINDLETRYAKLEEDYRTVQLAGEQQRKRLNQLESENKSLESAKNDLTRQLVDSKIDRESLRKQVAARTTERDNANTNLQQFTKELQALALRAETAMNSTAQPPGGTIIPVSRRSE